MPARENPADRGRERGRRATEVVRRQFRDARLDRGISQHDVARPLRLSASEVSRLERGVVPLDIETAAAMLAIVGLDLAVRVYPAGEPLRARGHEEVLERLRVRIHPTLEWRREVGLPIRGDLRAWDAVIRERSRQGAWIRPIEAETAPRDCQALEPRFPVPGQRALEVLAAGAPPDGSALIVL